MLSDSKYAENLHIQKSSCLVRSRCLSDISYDLTLNLPRGSYYSGKIQITFKVNCLPSDDEEDISIDFRGVGVSQFTVNGERQSEAVFLGHKLRLAATSLLPGQVNTVQLYFLTMYRTDGYGLASFIAKECGQQYLKTRFETDFCHSIFPCFD